MPSKLIETLILDESMCNIDSVGTLKSVNNRFFNTKKIVIPEKIKGCTVKSIGDGCLCNCLFEEIELPKSLTMLSNHSFAYCFNLKNIFIPDKVFVIGNEAFLQCENLRSVTLPKELKLISSQAFAYCKSLSQVVLPEKLEAIAISAFDNCNDISLPFDGAEENFPCFIPTKSDKLSCRIFCVKEINEILQKIDNKKYNICIPKITNEQQKKYLIKELDDRILKTTDLNCKLALLSFQQEVQNNAQFLLPPTLMDINRE